MKTDEFDKRFEEGEDITGYLDLSPLQGRIMIEKL